MKNLLGLGVGARVGKNVTSLFLWLITFINCEQNPRTQFVP